MSHINDNASHINCDSHDNAAMNHLEIMLCVRVLFYVDLIFLVSFTQYCFTNVLKPFHSLCTSKPELFHNIELRIVVFY